LSHVCAEWLIFPFDLARQMAYAGCSLDTAYFVLAQLLETFVIRLSYGIALFLTNGCSSISVTDRSATSEAAYQSITIEEFATALDQLDAYTVVNVHIPYEGEVPNTDLQIAYNNVEALTAALSERNAPIILYCRSGRMSAEASQSLRSLGYTNVIDVLGGMNAWTASGRALLFSEPEA
jgi:rhodanese-related sulfurtransferase